MQKSPFFWFKLGKPSGILHVGILRRPAGVASAGRKSYYSRPVMPRTVRACAMKLVQLLHAAPDSPVVGKVAEKQRRRAGATVVLRENNTRRDPVWSVRHS